MRNLFFKSSKKTLHEVLRALTYSASIATILFTLIICRHENLPNLFKLFSGFGLVLIMLESIFTIYDIDSSLYKHFHKSLNKTKSLFDHSINHLFYPIVFYLGLVIFFRYTSDLLIPIILSFLSFFLYFSYFVNLRKHLHSDHTDTSFSKRSSYKIDIIFNFFKLFSYFILTLGIFQLFNLQKVDINQVFFLLFGINFAYLYFHINRKHETTFLNVLMAILFSIITSIFVIQAKTSIVNFTAGIATIIFYLSSGIYYHKVDGTLNYKVLIEYGSIATILSIFLFSF